MAILMDDQGKPEGGSWSYDELNRKKLPKKYVEPALPEVEAFSNETNTWVQEHFPNAWGECSIGLPRTHDEAEAWIEVFLKERF